MVLSEIDILNPEVAGLHQPPPGVVQPTDPESFIAIKPGQKPRTPARIATTARHSGRLALEASMRPCKR